MTIQLNELNKSLQLQSSECKRSNEELEQFAFLLLHAVTRTVRMITTWNYYRKSMVIILDQKGHQYMYYATDGAKRE
jgi:chloramphenicol O-acetyltransferase